MFLDRVVLAVPHVSTSIEYCEDLFGCLVVDEIFDREGCARGVVLQIGENLLEFMEPCGPGPVLDFIEQGGTGAFAVGLAVPDPASIANSLSAKGLVVYAQTPCRFVVFPDECRGSGIVINKLRARPQTGLVKRISRVTYDVADLADAVAYFSRLLDIDSSQLDIFTAETDSGNRAIAWLDGPSATCRSSIEWISSDLRRYDAGRMAGDNRAVLCKVTVESERVQEIRKRANRLGYKWSEHHLNSLPPFPVPGNLLLQVRNT